MLYRSPNHCKDDFEPFINNLELNLDSVMANNPFLTVVLGDCNAKLSLWYNNDITTYEASKIEGATCQYGVEQIIKENADFICDSSSCIDLINTLTKFSYEIWSSFFASLKLSSPHNVRKSQP